MLMSRFALLLVVFIDVMGQGLIMPIVNTVLLSPDQAFLPHNTPAASRSLDYGIVMGVFFLSWFLGAGYISRLSDHIGRKRGILICLSGTLAGYVLTIVALYTSSFILLLIGRAVTGFTAANQPIAQAALVDVSGDDTAKSRNLGLVVGASAFGLLAGPTMAGVLSDRAVLGGLASFELPFYVAVGLVLVNVILILAYFREPGFKRRKVDFGPEEVVLSLWRIGRFPVVGRLCLVWFFAVLALNCVFVFVDTYLFRRFGFDTLQNSMALVVFGLAMAFGGSLLAPWVNGRWRKIPTVRSALAVLALFALAFALNPVPDLSYLLVAPIAAAFGVYYPTVLALFSAAVDETEQGWAMGVTISLFALGTGTISVLGGWLMAIDIAMPLYLSVGFAVIAIALIQAAWRGTAVRALDEQ